MALVSKRIKIGISRYGNEQSPLYLLLYSMVLSLASNYINYIIKEKQTSVTDN